MTDTAGRDDGTSRRGRVLLVEDDATVRRALVRILEQRFEVLTAADADEAAALLSTDLHAVVSDHDLGPDKPTGRAVLELARERAPGARRILISGTPRAFAGGEEGLWHAMFTKPVSAARLLEALEYIPPCMDR
jgi:DNA-binding NtrC family response regulator